MSVQNVILVRHGHTLLNADGRLRGELDVALDETGLREAEVLARVLMPLPIVAVISSPLARARETATPLSVATGAPLRVDERLRDRAYGEWAGALLADVQAKFGSIEAAPGVEPWEEVKSRARAAFETATDQTPGGIDSVVALVAHDAVLRALIATVFPSISPARLQFRTGSWTRLERSTSSERWHVVSLDDRPEELDPAGSS